MNYDSYLLWLAFFSSVRVKHRAAGVWWKRKTQTGNSLEEDTSFVTYIFQMYEDYVRDITLMELQWCSVLIYFKASSISQCWPAANVSHTMYLIFIHV